MRAPSLKMSVKEALRRRRENSPLVDEQPHVQTKSSEVPRSATRSVSALREELERLKVL